MFCRRDCAHGAWRAGAGLPAPLHCHGGAEQGLRLRCGRLVWCIDTLGVYYELPRWAAGVSSSLLGRAAVKCAILCNVRSCAICSAFVPIWAAGAAPSLTLCCYSAAPVPAAPPLPCLLHHLSRVCCTTSPRSGAVVRRTQQPVHQPAGAQRQPAAAGQVPAQAALGCGGMRRVLLLLLPQAACCLVLLSHAVWAPCGKRACTLPVLPVTQQRCGSADQALDVC